VIFRDLCVLDMWSASNRISPIESAPDRLSLL